MAGETEFSVPKVARQSQGQFSANRKARPAPEAEVSPQVQCGRYAMEQLSNILLRSHAILTLFDKDRFQIHYYDRSAIALSSIVNLSTPEGQELFIIMLMGLRRLTSEGLGLRKVLGESEKFYTELGYFKSQISEGLSKDWRRMFHGMKLCVGDKTYTLQEILFRQPGIVGRTTCVVAATDGQGTEVVVKISCPVERRQSEVDLIVRAGNTHPATIDTNGCSSTFPKSSRPLIFDQNLGLPNAGFASFSTARTRSGRRERSRSSTRVVFFVSRSLRSCTHYSTRRTFRRTPRFSLMCSKLTSGSTTIRASSTATLA
ncbi:hypothetical protein BDZ89DRAFT_67949 [Hymenopellis radicata]|nr:hypothetical protein BDZ89DRAFT_67949 [Hymenopellis radicata]